MRTRCVLVAHHSHAMGGLSRNGCVIDGRGVRTGRASRLDARRLLSAQTVAQVAGQCCAAGSLLADRCRCLDAPLDRCWSTPVAQRWARWPRACRRGVRPCGA
ncbi:hypothetical protein F511_47452 [Dorcoceras hygrometricum]|uniref:Uncharacterized protein n=1 Tax=Dorcoceras hygrometricum TaxID=472368 RepID=A0A2Z6ZXF8_9LAMI|nr:hypothetical protein F511_47452 [Dorcoceras hygrometricum]